MIKPESIGDINYLLSYASMDGIITHQILHKGIILKQELLRMAEDVRNQYTIVDVKSTIRLESTIIPTYYDNKSISAALMEEKIVGHMHMYTFLYTIKVYGFEFFAKKQVYTFERYNGNAYIVPEQVKKVKMNERQAQVYIQPIFNEDTTDKDPKNETLIQSMG